MMTKLKTALAAALALAALAGTVHASAFTAGTVTNLPAGDQLNIRKWPANTSRVVAVATNGEAISLTGRCKNVVTNASFRIDAGGSALWNYNRMQRANVWCQVMTENAYGDAEIAWVRGRFVYPE
jgi:hypothetical protein